MRVYDANCIFFPKARSSHCCAFLKSSHAMFICIASGVLTNQYNNIQQFA